MPLIQDLSQIQQSLRLTLLATAVSLATLSAASAQMSPAPSTTPMPAIAPSVMQDTFFNTPLQAKSWLASDAMDEPVQNLQQEKIGEVKNLVIDGDGKVVAAIVGIGGILGMGEKDVAINIKAIRMNANADGKILLVLDVSKDVLKSAPAYKPTITAKNN
jgi:PRC-barrel domain